MRQINAKLEKLDSIDNKIEQINSKFEQANKQITTLESANAEKTQRINKLEKHVHDLEYKLIACNTELEQQVHANEVIIEHTDLEHIISATGALLPLKTQNKNRMHQPKNEPD